MATEAIRPAQSPSTPTRLESKPKEATKPEPQQEPAKVEQENSDKRTLAEA
ncbi:MAG: hypothetical protein J0M12_09395 [Deltaproteobacteria bacterium]|nr:hypothetical protein [Deltaproteobacteria bacterium]